MSGSFLLVSAVGLIFLSREFYFQSLYSGWFHFASLIFIDIRAVTLNFQDFGLSVIESLPAGALTATLLLLVLTGLAFKFVLSAYASLKINLRRV